MLVVRQLRQQNFLLGSNDTCVRGCVLRTFETIDIHTGGCHEWTEVDGSTFVTHATICEGDPDQGHALTDHKVIFVKHRRS